MNSIKFNLLLTLCVILSSNYGIAQETLNAKIHWTELTLKKSSTQEFLVRSFNTNFILPSIRVNYFSETNGTQARVSAFNNLGVGVSWGGGRLITTTDEDFKITSKKFKNTLSFQAGVLYSIVNTSDSNTSTFALVGGISLLNFNLSLGREFGTLSPNQKKFFTSLSFNIPLSDIGINSMYLTRAKKESTVIWD